jgi:hypothetical protein
MKLYAVFFLVVPVLLFSCIKTDINLGSRKESGTGLIIKAGYICGWGSGTDSLEISQKGIKYVYYIPARSSEPIVRKSRTVTNEEWAEILNDVNSDQFAALNYQTCNVCFDGCDEWILIQNDAFTHKITFGKGLAIDTIANLQMKLGELRTEFNR